jgi:hypothetical protein
MKVSKYAIMTCSLVLLVFPLFVQAQTTPSSRDALKSVRNFVQEFYRWYVPEARDLRTNSLQLALKDRSYAFSPELFKALKEDSDARGKASGIVGLDFDPFLNAQDPCKRYELRGIIQEGNTGTYYVEVFGVCPVRPSSLPRGMPDVMAEVTRRDARWVFTNFLYPPTARRFPDSGNLLGILKLLREERQGIKPNTRSK